MIMIDPRFLVLSACMSTAAGLVGSFALMRRMTLTADALSHVALPGIGLALMFGLAPYWVAAGTLILGSVLIWALEKHTGISTETVTGVVFSTALAFGSLLTTQEDLIDALFGAPGTLTQWEFYSGMAEAVGIAAAILALRKRLVLTLVSPEIARISGIRVDRLNLLFLIVFAMTVALGLRYLGVLLMGALIIIPAATARRLAWNLDSMLFIASTAAVISALIGGYLAVFSGKSTGPLITCVASGLFALSLLRRPASHM